MERNHGYKCKMVWLFYDSNQRQIKKHQPNLIIITKSEKTLKLRKFCYSNTFFNRLCGLFHFNFSWSPALLPRSLAKAQKRFLSLPLNATEGTSRDDNVLMWNPMPLVIEPPLPCVSDQSASSLGAYITLMHGSELRCQI